MKLHTDISHKYKNAKNIKKTKSKTYKKNYTPKVNEIDSRNQTGVTFKKQLNVI